ncbi:DUF3757 domain-containing protein, partial [Pseudomonas mandelii]|uniref:DUF3757 domain-containing protein n=1 Tax=Pseudomonas mandelii TaxID=75612 RepID=UPI003C783E72
MAIKKLALLIPFLLAGNAWANVVEHCPRAADIQEVKDTGTYTAKSVGGNMDWHGTSYSGRGPVAQFDSARFSPTGEGAAVDGVVVGELRRCSYKLQDGGDLSMQFKDNG